MNEYIATFFTHFDAISCSRRLKKQGIDPVMAPVPRMLSSSCGSAVMFHTDSDPLTITGNTFEQLFCCRGDTYELVKDNRES